MNLTGKLILFSNKSDVLGVYLGYRTLDRFDKNLDYKFHKFLTKNGIEEFCIKSGKEKTLIKVIL